MSDASLLAGVLPAAASIAGAIGLAFLLAVRSRSWWFRTVPTSVVGAVVVVIVADVAVELWKPFPDPLSVRVLTWAAFAVLGLILTAVRLRPTPGASDLPTLGLDVLVADGKSPAVAKAERVATQAWEFSQAWMRGRGVRDVVVDRAHLLTARQAGALTEFAAGVGASLWLVWGGRDNPARLYPALRGTPGPVVEQIGLWEFRTQLPAPAPELVFPAPEGREWPVLPAANFTTFLAVCRRHLSRAEFNVVAEVYYDTAEACDTWLANRGWPEPGQHGFAAVLTGWLRDVAIGGAPSPAEALIRLRAVQAALFVHAIVLGWTPAALGPNPARRLLGDLTEARAGALATGCRTDAAAATALSLHLNLTGAHFERG